MAEVGPSNPFVPSNGSSPALDDVLTTRGLAHRPPRATDYTSENRALVALSHEMARNPWNLPQRLVDTAVDLCQAGTAGISVLKIDAGGEYLVWEAIAGLYAPSVGRRISRHRSPCGITLDRHAPQLFSNPTRYFPWFAHGNILIAECLVVPMYANDRALGTMWIMLHERIRQFDAEDVRLLTNLAAFASSALQVLGVLEADMPGSQTWRISPAEQEASHREQLIAMVDHSRPANATMDEGEWQFHRLLEKLPLGAYTCDPAGLITYFNPQAVELWGRVPRLHDPVDRFCGSFRLFAADGSPLTHDQCWMALALKKNAAYNGREIVVERPDGQRLTALAYANPMHDSSGTLLGAVNVLVDISDRKRAERALRDSEARLKVALHEKEILLKEIHHRVKNNLQVISSLLALQSHSLDNPRVLALFQESERRIHSMALVHETLYQTGELATFNLTRYISTLSTRLMHAYGLDARRIALHLDVEDIALPLDLAVPCGLILNELLSNCLKHAFPGEQIGEITVMLTHQADRLILVVRDGGCGFPADLDFRNTESLGLQLVCELTEQLQGKIALERNGGTAFTLTFPLPDVEFLRQEADATASS